MPIVVDEQRASFTLRGPDWEPSRDPLWGQVDDRERRAYWKQLGKIVVEELRGDLAAGVGADGKPFEPIRYERPDGATGPPLTPHEKDSRFRKLVRSAPGRDGVTVFWSHGWARIVGIHAFPKGPRALPVRNAVGLSPKAQARAKKKIREWWRSRHWLKTRYLGGRVEYTSSRVAPAATKKVRVFSTSRPKLRGA